MKRDNVGGSGWLLALVLSILTSLILGLTLVWLSIENTDMTYSIGQLQTSVSERNALRAKLEVERDRLLAPYELGRAALTLGMREAVPGQIRRLADGAAKNQGKQ
ncbi:MAG: hypothetical protein LBC10_03035 [Deltaproteobacteria bacterium]|jgi:hypothetical protein|nr:hypothetical protein [Deltaproteobacteria bacterium]